MNKTNTTAAALKKRISEQKKALAADEKQLNEMASQDVFNQIDEVRASVITLSSAGHDFKTITKKLKAVMSLTIGDGYEIKISKKAAPLDFSWGDLVDKMKDAGIKKANAASRKELERIFFDSNKKKFSQKWNDKEDRAQYLKSEGELGAARYWPK